ncbi:MAG: acyl-CoA thioesterase [Mobilicoccus sp.]|nr:acyl-CoA thioesterase [Mobilicoccus sp.]
MSARHVVEVGIRWSDLDPYHHVNNAKILTLLEEARLVALDAWFDRGSGTLLRGLMVAHQEIDYRAQMYYHPTITVEMWCSEIGGSSFVMGYEVHDREGRLVCVAETTMVCTDIESGGVRRLSEDERAELTARLDAPAPLRRRRKEGS